MLVPVLMLCLEVRAQILDFDSGPSDVGDAVATDALLTYLDGRIESLRADGDATPTGDARIGMRILVRRLLDEGSRRGEAGAVHVLTGRTLFNNIADLDAMIQSRSDVAWEQSLALMTNDWETLPIPGETADLDAFLRDQFAVLTEEWADDLASAWGAVPVTDTLGELVDALRTIDGRPAEVSAAIERIEQRLTTARTFVAYRPSANALERLVVDAGRVIVDCPRWVGADERHALAGRFDEAVASLAEQTDAAEAVAALRRLARVADLVGRLEDVGSGVVAREVRSAFLAELTSDAPSDFEMLVRVLDQRSARLALGDDSQLVRQLRPTWRALEPECRRAEEQLLQRLPAIIADRDAMTDPGVLAAIAAHRQLLASLEATIEANNAMRDPDAPPRRPVVHESWEKVANRLLTLSTRTSRNPEPDLDGLRGLIERIARYSAFPGEEVLRSGDPILAALTGGRASELADRIETSRRGWLASVASGEDEVFAVRLNAMRRLTAAISDVALVRSLALGFDQDEETRGNSDVQDWPGWELAPTAYGWLSLDAGAALVDLTADILNGSDDDDRLDQFEERHAVVLLIARLERDIEASGLRLCTGSQSCVLHEIATGAPDRFAARADQRQRLAVIAGYADELAVAIAAHADERAETIRLLLADRVHPLLPKR